MRLYQAIPAIVGALVGAAAASPAAAQGSGTFPPTNRFQFLPPYSSTPQMLLERDFAYMRGTIGTRPLTPPTAPPPTQPPPPGHPRPCHCHPWLPGYGYGGYFQSGGFGYGGYFPYGGGFGYGGLYISAGPYGAAFFPGGVNTVHQREVYVYGQVPGGEGYGRGTAPPPQQGGERPAPSGGAQGSPSREVGGDFYLGRGRGTETLNDALDDIRKAWLNGDFDRLKARFDLRRQVKIFPGGQFRYAVDAAEFLAVVESAMKRIDTTAFEFDRPQNTESSRAFVSGKHTFLDAEKQKQETHISYVLERLDGKWRIVEAGSGSSPITRHTE